MTESTRWLHDEYVARANAADRRGGDVWVWSDLLVADWPRADALLANRITRAVARLAEVTHSGRRAARG